MGFFAEQEEGLPVPLEDVASRQEISKKYLETIVNLLVKAKLLKSQFLHMQITVSPYSFDNLLYITKTKRMAARYTNYSIKFESEVCPYVKEEF